MAIHKLSNQKVIVKKVAKGSGNSNALLQLESEAQFRFTSTLLQSSIALIESSNFLFLVKEYHTGIPLSEYWKTVKRKDRFTQLIHLVELTRHPFNELQKLQLVHADIKPSNLLVELDDLGNLKKVKLIDFGLAFYTHRLPKRKTLFALGFSAPELILNQLNTVNHSTDLYAFGSVIFWLLESKIPNLDENPALTTNLQINLPLPELSWRYKNIQQILHKLTHKHAFKLPPNRMSSQEMNAHLSRAMSLRYQNLDEFYRDLITKKEKRFF